MKVDRVRYRGWPEAYRCFVDSLELVVVTSIGPRILSLRLGDGENLLFEDGTDFKVGAWRLYGGHRFTIAPESEASYMPDNQRCQVDLKDDLISIDQRLGDRLLRRLEITHNTDRKGFVLRHVIRNCSSEPWHGAAWAVTCVPPSGRVLVPVSNPQARFWSVADSCYAGPSDPQWQRAQDWLTVQPPCQKGKVGLRSEAGWLAWLGSECTFVISSPAPELKILYPDDGCNVEVYTCAEYLELETLGPLTSLSPGQELVHRQGWQVSPRRFTPSQWRSLGRLRQMGAEAQVPTGTTA